VRLRTVLPLLLLLSGCGSSAGLHIENGGRTVRTQPAPPAAPSTADSTGKLPRHVTARVAVGGTPRLAWDSGRVWAACWPGGPHELGSLLPIDARTGKAGKPLPLAPSPQAYLVGAAGGKVFVTAGNTVLRLDPSSGAVIATATLSGRPRALLATRDAVWVTVEEGALLRLDPDRLRSVLTVASVASPYAVTVGPGTVFVTDDRDQSLEGLDARTGRAVSSASVRGPEAGAPSEITLYSGSLWVYEGTSVVRIGAGGGRVLDRIALTGDGGSIAAGTGGVWATGAFGVARIDPATGELGKPITLGGPGRWLATTGDAVWVSIPGAVLRVSG
jgi:streptogramin lyase